MKNQLYRLLLAAVIPFFLSFQIFTLKAQTPIYYNAGGAQYISLAGDTFKADLYYTPGGTSTYTNTNVNLTIDSTLDDLLYKTERSANVNGGSFGYNIPVANGLYKIRLHFAEIFYGATGGNLTPPFTGKRVFHVVLEGDTVLKNYDINADVGPMRAIIKEYDSVAVNDANIDIDFASVTNKAKISAISIIPISIIPSSNTPPTFITSGNVTVDEDFVGTQTVTVTPNPVPPADAAQTVTYSLTPPSVAFATVFINTTTGLVSITKVTNKNGSQLFTITANDGQPANNIATQNFTLTVNAVNDAPAFTTSGSITVNKNFAGTQTVNVTPAAVPADETGQVVAYSLNPPSVAFANVSINTNSGQVSITSVANAFGTQLFTITANDQQGLNNTATQNFTLTVNDVAPATQKPIHFNCGGTQYITLALDTFVPDLYYSSGTTTSSNNIVPDIFGTADDALYRTERFKNDFTYNIPVQNGAYTVKLHFAEIFFGVAGGNLTPPFTGKRVFHVVLEGDSVLKNYDINADVGPDTAVIKQFDNVQINDGTITINLKGVVNNAKISAISITPAGGPANTPPTVSITAPNVGASFIEATAIQINADAADIGGSISKVEFYQNGNLLNTDFTFPYSFIWNNSTPGGKALTAKAFDNNNASATSTAVNITVTADAAPSVSITSPADGANFTAGASIQINANATDDLGVANVEFYEGANLLGSDNSFPYSFLWNNPAIGNYSLTAKAFDGFGHSTPSSAITVHLLADAPPTVSITSPADGATFTEGQTVVINATANDDLGITQVDFYAGATFLGSDNSFPYSFSWTNVQEGNYALTATAFDTQVQATVSAAVNITVDTIPVGNLAALFVVGNLSLNNGDQAVKTRLETLGFNVTVVLASSSATEDANGNNLILISSTVTAASVGTKFTNVTIPVINWEQGLHDDLGMTSGVAGNSGSTGVAQTQINIIGAGHPLAASLPNGLVTIHAPAQIITWGKPSVNAVKIATITGSATQIAIFGYETGVAMVSGNAPARRVGLFLNDAGAAFLTASGTALLDAAITWAANSTPPPPNNPPNVSITNPVNAASFISPANITIDATASDPDLGGSISLVEFYQGAALLGSDNSFPYSFTWNNPVNGSYQLTAKSYDNLNASTTSAIVNITVNPPANNPPSVSITNPANAASFSALANITIDATANDPDLGGSISLVEFYQGAVLLGSDNSFPYSYNWNGVTQGSYQLTAKAFDNLNASTTSAIVNITVNPPANNPPSVSITNPANAASFSALANITIDATANDPDLGGSISLVEFYHGAVLLGSDNSFPYSYNWNGVTQGSYQLTAKAFDNLNASTTSSIVNITVNQLPTVSITNPTNAATFTAPANITIDATAGDVGGSISLVEFYQGAVLLGSDNSFPYSYNWNGVTQGSYQLTAKAFDNLNASTISTIVNVTVSPAATLGNILFVVGNLSLNNGDNAVKTRLETLGYSVILKLASASVTADANGKSAVLISSTINSTDVASKFTNVTVPVMNWEQGLNDDLKLVSSSGGNAGTTVNQTVLNIIGTGHPLAASLPNGVTAVYASAQTVSWGKPSVNAIKIATTSGSASNIAIFGYESNATMVGLNAPARRVGFFLQDAGAAFYTANGTALFDAAINWLVTPPAPNNPPSVSITSPLNGAIFNAPANITIDATASDPDLGGSISLVEFYQGASLLGLDNSFPYSFNWNGVTQGSYQLTAKAFDNLNASTTSTIVNIVVNAPANNPPSVSITNPLNNAVVVAPANITIDANASDPDLGGTISKVEFYQGANLLSIDLSAPYQFVWNGVTAGSYQVTAKAFDNLNASTTSSIVNITVNQLPTASITNPVNAATFNAPANITIDATAADVGGTISKVEFYEGVNLLGTDISAPYSFGWNSVAQGSYQLTAKAFDNLNASTTSTFVNITVNPGNQPPVTNISNPLNGASFTSPANIAIAATASDPDVGGSISKVEFYVGATLLGTDFTAPYSLNWNGVGNGTYQLKAKAFDNLSASTFSSIITITVGAVVNLPPVVSITNPINNATFNAPANITIDATASDPTVGGSISKVEFYQGVNLLGTDLTAPYSFNLNGVTVGNYQLTAKAFDNLNAATTSSIVNIIVNNPVSNSALFVVGNTTLNTGDAAVKAKLESMGYTVTVVSDVASTTADANGKTIVLISATVVSGNVNTKFTNVAVPVINWEAGIMDDLKLTGTATTEYGTVFNQTQINIIGTGHPLAAGLPNGLTTVFNSVQTTTWAKPNSNAVSIATISGNATQVCIFGYQTGASMFGINAPARRVGFMVADQSPAALNTAGMQLLEAAILWVVGTSKNDKFSTTPMESEISIEANVYPNPSSGIFILELNNTREGKLSVGIYNQFGQEVYFGEKTIDNASYLEQFDLSSLSSGLYLIHITNGETKLTRRLLIID